MGSLSTPEAQTKIEFLRFLDTQEGAVAVYYVRPRLIKTDGEIVLDDTFLDMGNDARVPNEAALIKSMLVTLGAGIKKARALVEQGDSAKVMIPINGAALIRTAIAKEFTKYCRPVEDAVRQSIVFEVVNLEVQPKTSLLDGNAVVLYPFCHSYCARIQPKTEHYRSFTNCNFSGLAIDLMEKPWPVDKVGSFLTKFGHLTKDARLQGYVHGIGTTELFQAVQRAEIRFASGKGVEQESSGGDQPNSEQAPASRTA